MTLAGQDGVDGFSASSAGTRAVIGHPIHENAVVILGEAGGVASDFAARQFTPKVAAEADLIVTMTSAHRDAVLERAPNKLHRTFLLSEVAGLVTKLDAQDVAQLSALRSQLTPSDRSDIPDPIGHDLDYFRTVGEQIAALLPSVVELCRRSSAAAQ